MSYKLVHVTPTVTAASIYHTGDAVGGLLEFENVCTPYENSGVIVGAMVHDNDKESSNLFLSLLKQTFTPTADHDEFALSDADLHHCMAIIEFKNADYVDYKDNSVCHAGQEIGFTPMPFVLVKGGTSLFGQLYVSANVATYTAVNDLHVMLIIKE